MTKKSPPCLMKKGFDGFTFLGNKDENVFFFSLVFNKKKSLFSHLFTLHITLYYSIIDSIVILPCAHISPICHLSKALRAKPFSNFFFFSVFENK